MKRLALTLILRSGVLLTLLASGISLAAQAPDSEKINRLFNNIRGHAMLVEYHAEQLEACTRCTVSWQGHAAEINNVKYDLNDLLEDFSSAKRLREQGSPWQQQTIDQLEPMLTDMADHLTATIKFLNTHQNQTQMKPWKDYVKTNREYATTASSKIRDVVKYAESKERVESLGKSLHAPAKPGQ